MNSSWMGILNLLYFYLANHIESRFGVIGSQIFLARMGKKSWGFQKPRHKSWAKFFWLVPKNQSNFVLEFLAWSFMGFLETPSQFQWHRENQSFFETFPDQKKMIDSFKTLDFVMGFLETPSLFEVKIWHQSLIDFSGICCLFIFSCFFFHGIYELGTWTPTCQLWCGQQKILIGSESTSSLKSCGWSWSHIHFLVYHKVSIMCWNQILCSGFYMLFNINPFSARLNIM